MYRYLEKWADWAASIFSRFQITTKNHHRYLTIHTIVAVENYIDYHNEPFNFY